jgi:hypothetical protein
MLNLQEIGVKLVMGLLGMQCLGGMIWVTLWLWTKALSTFINTVGFSAAFVDAVFQAVKQQKWYTRWR